MKKSRLLLILFWAPKNQKPRIQYIVNQIVFPPPISAAPKKPLIVRLDCPMNFLALPVEKDALNKLELNLSHAQPGNSSTVVISGTGGVGKSQLAVAVAYEQMKCYQETQGKSGCGSVIWFIAGTDEGIDNPSSHDRANSSLRTAVRI